MAISEDEENVAGLERLALQAISSATPEGKVRETARRILAGYCWREPFHQVMFEALMSTEDSRVIRELLPARLTRKGFPDFDIDDLFEPSGLSPEQIQQLFERIRAAGSRDRR
jgi:hypothetical protein